MTETEVNRHFAALVFSLHASAWMHLGKVTNPETGETERNMDAAKETIDLLGALEEKTRGNLVPDEEKLMRQLLTELRMNYVDELKRASEESKPTQSEADAPAAGREDAPGVGAADAPAGDTADAAAEEKGAKDPGGSG